MRGGKATTAVLLAGVSAVLLAGCSPDDQLGIGKAPSGNPIVTNCGLYIRGVDAHDAESGQIVWSAEISSEDARSEGTHDVADVEIGSLPIDIRNGEIDETWVESVAFDAAARPEVWLFTIDTYESTTIRVPDSDLREGFVYVPGKSSVTEAEFVDDVCGYAAPGALRWWLLGGFVLFVVVPIGGFLMARRQKQKRSLPPWPPPTSPSPHP